MPQFIILAKLRADIAEDAPKGTLEAIKKMVERRLQTPIFADGVQVTLKEIKEDKPDDNAG